MKPSVQDATHYHPENGMWYKFGEFTVYFWDSSTGGWSTSMCSRKAVNSSDFVTAQKALERGYKYPQYPTTTEGVIVDSTPSGEVLEASTHLVPDMTEANDRKQRVNTSVTSANNRQVGGDHYKKMKIQPWDLFGSIFNLDEQIGFYLGNVYKYLMRYDSKNGIEDLMKAKHYLEKLIEVKRGAASADVTDKH